MIATEDEGLALRDGGKSAQEAVVELERFLRWRGPVEDVACDYHQIRAQVSQLRQEPIDKDTVLVVPLAIDESRAEMPVRGMDDARHEVEWPPLKPGCTRAWRIT